MREGRNGQKTPLEKHLETIKNDYQPPKEFDGGERVGKYTNFVLFADMSDPDVIRVGNDYFMVTSTFHLCPGLTVLHSTDLVNWEIIGHALKDISKLCLKFSHTSMDGYGNCVWAPSLRYHNGKYYIHVGGPDMGLIVCETDDIYSDNWEVRRIRFPGDTGNWIGDMLIDCCPLWDDDGKAYFSASEPYWAGETTDYHIYLFEMDPNGREFLDQGCVIHNGRISEATKLYKINGYYYMLFREHPSDEVGRGAQFAARSRNPYGPFEIRKLLHSHHPEYDLEPSQGGLVEDTEGNWWFLCHGMNFGSPLTYIGRPLMLLPVSWEDGWPIIGTDIDGDGIGEMTWEHEMPPRTGNTCSFQTSDSFRGATLGMQWEWNHAPRNDLWSLTGEALRLYAARPIKNGGFYNACNTLTQRLVGEKSEYEVKLSVNGLADGQFAGLVVFQDISELIGIYQENGKRYIRHIRTRKDTDCGRCHHDYFIDDLAEFDGDSVTLIFENDHGRGRIGYLSGSERKFTERDFRLTMFAWRGCRVGVFTWNDFRENGYADFSDFSVKK